MKKLASQLLLSLAIGGITSVLHAQTDILITVDLSPSTTIENQFNLSINAAPGLSLATNSSQTTPTFTFQDGFDLANFLTVPFNFEDQSPVFPSTLSTSIDDSPVYDTLFVDDLSTNDPTMALDLNAFSSGDPTDDIPEDFTAGTQAFTTPGSIDGYINGDRTEFAPSGFIGNIYEGYSGDYDAEPVSEAISDDADPLEGLVILGQYEVFDIPEPSRWSLLMVGVVSLFAFGRYRAVRVNS